MNTVVKSTASRGDFAVEIENRRVVQVTYKSHFSSVAGFEFNGERIEICPHNIWHSRYDILKNGVCKGDIRFNWKWNIIIRLTDGDTEETYMVKSKNIFGKNFEITDSQKNPLFLMKPKFKWRTRNFEYDVMYHHDAEAKNPLLELLVYATYGINLYLLSLIVIASYAS